MIIPSFWLRYKVNDGLSGFDEIFNVDSGDMTS